MSVDLAKDIGGNCETRDNLIISLTANTKRLNDMARIVEDLARTNLEATSELRLVKTVQKQLIEVCTKQNELTQLLIDENKLTRLKMDDLIEAIGRSDIEILQLRNAIEEME